MTATRIRILYLLCYLFSVSCELNLTDGSPCVSEGLNGTCVSVFRCRTAYSTLIYRRAGYNKDTVPEFPEICSFNGEVPTVCCTDCDIGDDIIYTSLNSVVVAPNGDLIKKVGPKSRDKCLDYFQDFPYSCRGAAPVKISKSLDESNKCYDYVKYHWSGVGGRDAERWEFPHMALLGYGSQQESAKWLCGGSIISESFIITAAHCTNTKSFGPVTFAALGLLKRSDPLEYWNIYKIKRAITHPEYKPPSKYHDIALLETETKIQFTEGVLPACLQTNTDYNNILKADASGWGQIGRKNPLADTLQVMSLEKYNDAECSLLYPEHRHLKKGFDNTTQMCYGVHNAIVDTCQGDSGGPLQINEEECLYTVAGLTSYGKDCGIPESAGVYTRVSHYVPWIESIVWAD